MKKGLIYANISSDHRFAIGYLNWYKSQFRYYATSMFQNQYSPEILLQILERLEKQAFHFAARIRKTHHVCIPIDPMIMKLKAFLREQADIVINENQQPELPFKGEIS